MIRILGTILAGLLGLAFGSFLNVCLSRWPEGESVVAPRSHCRNCGRTLAWWENIPLVSWLTLRTRCRSCKARISWRYPLVELTIGASWSFEVWHGACLCDGTPSPLDFSQAFGLAHRFPEAPFLALGFAILIWILVTLAVLDAEHLWLPNWITLSGIVLGLTYTLLCNRFRYRVFVDFGPPDPPLAPGFFGCIRAIVFAAALILLIRWTYWLIRRREGIGLGDAKLMAMLGAWLGLSGALLSFALGVGLGAIFALIVLAVPAARRESNTWLAAKLPLGTFLCIGGIISTLWGQPIINAYLHWAGF